MGEIVIGPYSNEDRKFVRSIAYNTALLGDCASAFFDDREIAEDFLTSYFIDYEPQSCFVAKAGGRIIGYLLGAKDTSALRRISKTKIIPKLLIKAITHNIIFSRKSAIFIINGIFSLFKGEFKSPDFSKDYPATLHINIEEGFRSQGIGAKLIAAYLDYLVKEKIKGVHFATLSDKAARFYDALGFILLHKSRRSYLRYILHRDTVCYVYGKKLTSLP